MKKKIKNQLTPYNIIAEQNILGQIFINNEKINKINNIIKKNHFYLPIHQKIYQGLYQIISQGGKVDPISFKNYLINESFFKNINIDCYEYLLKIIEESKLITNIVSLSKSIYDSYLRRKLINISEQYIIKARDQNTEINAQNLLNQLEESLYNISNFKIKNSYTYTLNESIKNVIYNISKVKNENLLIGLNTKYNELNNYTGGLQNSDFIVIAGRPSMGKTAFVVNLAINIAEQFIKEKKSVCFFSLEMSSIQIATRIISIMTNIEGHKIRTGKIDNNTLKDIFKNIVNVNIPLIIEDSPYLTISDIKTKARKMKEKYNMSLLIVDYLQLIQGNKKNRENRVLEIGEISQGLKSIAKELNIPVIAASQLSRSVENREDKIPLLSDLRESGNIEQDADLVIFIYREEYYLSRKKPKDQKMFLKWKNEINKVKEIANIIIAKHRNGPIGNFNLKFNCYTTKFKNFYL